MTGPGIYIDDFAAFLVAFGLGAILVVHGWLTGARRRTIASRVFGVVYGSWVVSMTLLPFLPGPLGSGAGLDPYWRNSVNLVPGETIELYLTSDLGHVAWQNLLGNLLLLVPLGALGPLAWRKLDRWGRVIGAGLGISVSIEVLQFAKRFFDMTGMTRSVDIDDVLLNTAGVAIGYATYRIVRAVGRLFSRRTPPGDPA
ncbi:MAG: VanZ family protein [Coriobacteriia bacterium]|nr:VanZ family protein [Coriobacteriia bacterium]MBN2840544.1 VanZ family protein [Coriobacteriia bacterium]